MMRNINFCIKNFNSKRFIAVAPHQPLVAAFDHLEFMIASRFFPVKVLSLSVQSLEFLNLKKSKAVTTRNIIGGQIYLILNTFTMNVTVSLYCMHYADIWQTSPKLIMYQILEYLTHQ